MQSERRKTRAGDAKWWLWALLVLNAMWVVDLFVLGGEVGVLTGPQGLVLALGRLTGLGGALALVLQLVLIARVPWLERRLGMDRLTSWHRWTGTWVLWLVSAHVVLITVGYAEQDRSPVLSEFGSLVSETGDLLLAAAGAALLVVVGVTSARAARRRMRYETWHFLHLGAYLAVLLGFLHQVTSGNDFVGSPIGRAYWWTLYGAALGMVLVFRFLLPLWRMARHDTRVLGVVPEGPDVVSIHIGGRRLDRLPARAGQFFLWRFLATGLCAQAHPYSLSAMPDGKTLRITVKALGDGSAALRNLRVGTRVLAEGPYGAFTTEQCTGRDVLLIGGGVGVTPIRALLEELAQTRQDVVVLYRVGDQREAVLVSELQWLAQRAGAQLHVVIGPATAVGRHGPIMGPQHLAALVPGIRHRDVFLCGPPGMTDAVLGALRTLGVPRAQCHTERFAFAA
ncbi:ferredoxin reductase family protein [Saccharopolyspora phatthalungensis]|uniref:Putative ferric reductase n=1 Tax=Saccharopolyspora phatthalungensis TaxID=664693 RepID=A0A840PZY1_9PSEU|nr:ferredoxin reductase family protein [Saccharopolyspora phatthalungensis]MBB5153846.1 putative ferric reductase [Saccharopolyspora phatthalungensis]